MPENKTKETGEDVAAFLAAVADPARREDARTLCAMMARATSEPPKMWSSIIGFGRYHYCYDSGREGDWMLSGFAVRAKEFVLYLGLGVGGFEDLLARLGKHKTGKGCLYVKSLAEVDLAILDTLIRRAHAAMRERHAA